MSSNKASSSNVSSSSSSNNQFMKSNSKNKKSCDFDYLLSFDDDEFDLKKINSILTNFKTLDKLILEEEKELDKELKVYVEKIKGISNKEVRKKLIEKKKEIQGDIKKFKKHKRYYSELMMLHDEILKKGSNNFTINEVQDLCHLIMEFAFYYKDQQVVKKFFFGDDFADKDVNIKAFKPQIMRGFYAKNYTRVNGFLSELRSQDENVRDSALEKFNDNPYQFIVDKNSKYLSGRKSFDYGFQLKEQIRKIKNKEELDAGEVFESVLNHHFQVDVPRFLNKQYKKETDEINSKLFSFYSKLTIGSIGELNKRVDSSHLITENEKKDLLGEIFFFYSSSYFKTTDQISDLNSKIKECKKKKDEDVYKEKKFSLVKEIQSYDRLMQKAISYLSPLWQIPGNNIEKIEELKKLAITPNQLLNYKEALEIIDKSYSKNRQMISRLFKSKFTEGFYDEDVEKEKSEPGRTDNVSPDHTLVLLVNGRYFDASFQPLGDQRYIGCHAPHNEKSSLRYYEVMLNQNIETVVSLTESMEKSNEYNFYVNSQTPLKVFKEGDRTIEVKWLEDVADDCKDIGEIEQVKVRKIQVKETVMNPRGMPTVRTKTLHQICLQGWEDHGLVPPKVMEQLAQAVYKYNIDDEGNQKAPLMGHCHGGVGRWGTTLLSLHYSKQFERLRRNHQSFKMKLTSLKENHSGEDYRHVLLNTMTTMLDTIYQSKKIKLNSIVDKETRLKEIDLLEEYYENMSWDIHKLGSIAKKEELAESLLSQIEKEPADWTFNIQEDLFRLRLFRDAVQGPEQLASVYNFVTHLYDNYNLKINPNYTPKAQLSISKASDFTILENARRLAGLQNSYYIAKHEPSKEQNRKEQRKDYQNFIQERANSIKKIVFRDFNDKATINNLTNRFCKLHKSVHFFLKAMEDANISYLELDKLIVNDSKLKGLRPGIALSRLLCHSNLHDLIKVVHKVSPDLFQKLGKLLKSDLNQAHEKKNVRPDEKSIANWLRVTIPVELQGACRELLISVLLQEKEENCKKLTNQEASFDDKELYREELANLIGLLPTEKQDYYMRRAVDSIDWSNIAHGRMALEGVTRNFSREYSFSKEELTELVDMRHVIDSVDWSDYEKGMKKLQQVTNFFDNHYAKSKSGITNVETKKISKANNQSDSVNNHSMNSSTSSSSSTFWSSASSSSSNQSKTYDEDILKNNFFK